MYVICVCNQFTDLLVSVLMKMDDPETAPTKQAKWQQPIRIDVTKHTHIVWFRGGSLFFTAVQFYSHPDVIRYAVFLEANHVKPDISGLNRCI